MNTALTLDALSKTYSVGLRKRQRRAISNLTLTVPVGSIFGLLGPNGAGKTTAIKMTMGFLKPDSGSVKIFGLNARTPEVRSRIGFLPEQPYFYPYLSAEKALDFYGRLFGIPMGPRRETIEGLLDLVGLGPDKALPLRKFSKGMLQRFGVAQALINDPDLLILDEPTSGLDPIGRVEMRELLVSLNKQGKSILLSSHYLAEIEHLCHEVAFLNKGSVLARGSIETLLNAGDVYAIDARRLPCEWTPKESPLMMQRWGDGFRLNVEGERLDETIDVIRGAGGHIENVKKVTKTLEELFLELVGGTTHGN